MYEVLSNVQTRKIGKMEYLPCIDVTCYILGLEVLPHRELIHKMDLISLTRRKPTQESR
jgi:hypothetical protein